MKINLPDRQRWLVIGAAVVVALFLLDKVLFTPLINKWKEHSEDIVRLQKSVSDGRLAIARAARTEREWEDMKTNSLPKNSSQAENELYSAMNQWAVANRVEVNYRSQWLKGKTDKYSLYEARIDAAGTLSAITNFLYELEHSPLALRVDSVELTSRDDSGSKLTLGLVVSGLRLVQLEKIQK
ncbi:MAG: hypothetical protein ABIO94_08610 [Opitutaceae bacterium]